MKIDLIIEDDYTKSFYFDLGLYSKIRRKRTELGLSSHEDYHPNNG